MSLNCEEKTPNVLITNEHYVDYNWIIKRYISWLYHSMRNEKKYYGAFNIRAPHPDDGEHWRTKSELTNMFDQFGYD